MELNFVAGGAGATVKRASKRAQQGQGKGRVAFEARRKMKLKAKLTKQKNKAKRSHTLTQQKEQGELVPGVGQSRRTFPQQQSEPREAVGDVAAPSPATAEATPHGDMHPARRQRMLRSPPASSPRMVGARGRGGRERGPGAPRMGSAPRGANRVPLGPQRGIVAEEELHRALVGASATVVDQTQPSQDEMDMVAQYEQVPLFTDRNITSFGLESKMIKNLHDLFGLEKFTQIQAESLPVALRGSDLLIKSHTGSGKTLSFVIPIIHMLSRETPPVDRTSGTRAIILSPTRELCLQICEVIEKVVKPYINIVPGIVMGGEKKKAEKARLRKGVSVLVATPGRLLDHLQTTKSFRYDLLRFLVLDEADRLLDLGFEKDITQILSFLDRKLGRRKRQTFLASATLDRRVLRLAMLSLLRPVQVGVQQDRVERMHVDVEDADSVPIRTATNAEDPSQEEADESRPVDLHELMADAPGEFALPKSLRQHVLIAQCRHRLVALLAFLRWQLTRKDAQRKLVLFLSNCDSVDFFATLLPQLCLPRGAGEIAPTDEGTASRNMFTVPFVRLHGNMTQKERTQAFFLFNKMTEGVLLCTDVASRGLDLPKVEWIIQYDPPGDPRNYLHRVGRTARLGQVGNSLLFLQPHEEPYLTLLAKYNVTMNRIPINIVFGTLHKVIRTKDREEAVSTLQTLCEEFVSSNADCHEFGLFAFQSYTRAYTTHAQSTKDIFNVHNLHLGHVARSFALKESPSAIMAQRRRRPKANTNTVAQKAIEAREKRMKSMEEKRMARQLEMQQLAEGSGRVWTTRDGVLNSSFSGGNGSASRRAREEEEEEEDSDEEENEEDEADLDSDDEETFERIEREHRRQVEAAGGSIPVPQPVMPSFVRKEMKEKGREELQDKRAQRKKKLIREKHTFMDEFDANLEGKSSFDYTTVLRVPGAGKATAAPRAPLSEMLKLRRLADQEAEDAPRKKRQKSGM